MHPSVCVFSTSNLLHTMHAERNMWRRCNPDDTHRVLLRTSVAQRWCIQWEDGGGGHCLVRMEWRSARWSVCLPLLIFPYTIKSRSSLLALATPLPSNRHHQSSGDCLEGKRENYQVCSVQYCVQ